MKRSPKLALRGSIRRKLTLIVMVSSCAALLLACLAFVVNDAISYRQVLRNDLITRAQIIGNNSTAALSFGESKPVEEIMAALSADPHLVAACVFDAEHRVFAQYPQSDVKIPFPLARPEAQDAKLGRGTDADPEAGRPAGQRDAAPARDLRSADDAWFTSGHINVLRSITLNDRTIGYVFLRSDLRGLYGRVRFNALVTALVMLAAIGLAFLLSARLQRIVSDPLTQLAQVTARVARDKDFSLRVPRLSEDEIGELVERFNEMLAQIQGRDAALRGAQDALEQRVAERTSELRTANELLNVEVENRKRSQQELEAMQQRLMEASRQAGMAEVATGVLHNVGNVLNSVNVSTTVIQERLLKSKLTSLVQTAELLREQSGGPSPEGTGAGESASGGATEQRSPSSVERPALNVPRSKDCPAGSASGHSGALAKFLTEDPRGRRVPRYLIKLAAHLAAEREELLRELSVLARNLEHIKEVVVMQQSYAKMSGVAEILPPAQLVEDALRMNETALARHGVQVVREFAEVPLVSIDKHKVLQILVNLIRNAKQALKEAAVKEKRLTLRVAHSGPDKVAIVVQDNGVGIPSENLARIFQHGFTTKHDGHGFGLHSGANAAKEMGGSLSAASEGLGRGATFTLELPAATVQRFHKAA
jgi:C4-dicarboxylate-specific signal transduction histidine kinase